MTFQSRTPIESLLAAAVADPRREEVRRALLERRREAMASLVERLRADSAIEVLERFEQILKALLSSELSSPLSGNEIRELATFQRDLGFLLKYKSYAIKASSPLGYSVFLQNPGEGFSFQRHISHKTEIFCIVDVLPGGYVFVCDFDEWQRVYRRDAFQAWLNGEPDSRYERFRCVPQPGDVIAIDRLNVVHTAVGCTLAEFATVSTDMVDRLHDQNEGRPVPARFSRDHAEARLRDLRWPRGFHRVSPEPSGHTRIPLVPQPITGGSRTLLGEGPLIASSYRYDARDAGDIATDADRATCLHIVAGTGQLLLGEAREMRRVSPPSIAAGAGDIFLVAPGAHYGFVNDGDTPLVVSEQRIPSSTAFV
jgi:hypothetical protein